MSIFKGSGVAIITPFNENGINFPKFKELKVNHETLYNNIRLIVKANDTHKELEELNKELTELNK